MYGQRCENNRTRAQAKNGAVFSLEQRINDAFDSHATNRD